MSEQDRIIVATWRTDGHNPVPHVKGEPAVWVVTDWTADNFRLAIGSAPGTKVEIEGYVLAENHARVAADLDALAMKMRGIREAIGEGDHGNALHILGLLPDDPEEGTEPMEVAR